jgi:hypothetical protein
MEKEDYCINSFYLHLNSVMDTVAAFLQMREQIRDREKLKASSH